jgi:hypothetical protein
MRRRIRLGFVLIASTAVLAVGATAGAALGSPAGASPIEKAATKSSKASTVKFDFTVAISGGGASIPGGKISLGGSGAVNTKHQTADFKLNLGSLSSLLAGATNGVAVPKSIEVVSTSKAVYINFPALATQLGAHGKTWVKFDLSKLPKSVTGGVDPTTAGNISPQQAISMLRSALSVHKVGSDRYGTHYHATVHLSSFIALLPKAQQASTRASLAQAGINSVPFDAWVGKAGYLSRVVASLSVKAQKGQPAVKVAFTINLHDYGHAVHISTPPASKTADGSALLSGLAGITGG